MIDLQTALSSDNPLILSAAIKQREKLRLEKLDLIERLRTHDYSSCIAHTRAEIAVLQQRLERELRQQNTLPDTICSLQTDRAKLTAEIAKLRALLPKDAAGKLAKKLDKLDLPQAKLQALLELLNA